MRTFFLCLLLTTELAGQMPLRAQPGLKGQYYTGTQFEKLVMTRTDPSLHFDWRGRTPGPGLPQSYYSVRWTGKLLAPTTGTYVFFAKVDDGIRLWVGNRLVIDAWQLHDSVNFKGAVILKAGEAYDLRVDYFNDMLGGVIDLFWQLPNSTTQAPITAQYFRQTAPPPPAPPRPIRPEPPVPTPPRSRTATATVRPTRPEKRATVPPVSTPPSTATIVMAVSNPPRPTPPASPTVATPPGETLVLRSVQFEQSSYGLLPGTTAELDQLARALVEHPGWVIQIAGHTDNVGDARLNQALSEQRARVVAFYLYRHGVADTRMNTVGYGGSRPLVSNDTEAGRAQNRRVEITYMR
ncbi:PA14 domain-containing protein [Spirosoma luteolum]